MRRIHAVSQRAHATTLCAIALTALVGCNAGGGLHTYVAPEDPGPATLTLGSAASVDEIVARARQAGLTVVSADRASGLVTIRSDGPALVDCGAITQNFDGRRAEIAGASPSAVLIDFDVPGDVLVRRTAITSTATVQVLAGQPAATVSERHEATFEQVSALGDETYYRETQAFDEASRARFLEGTSCVSSGALRSILRG